MTHYAVESAPDGTGAVGRLLSLRLRLQVAERAAIQDALTVAQGNRRETARLLGISIRRLFYKLNQHGIK